VTETTERDASRLRSGRGMRGRTRRSGTVTAGMRALPVWASGVIATVYPNG